MQSKITVRYHYKSIRVALANRGFGQHQCWPGRGATETLIHCWWECKMLHWKTIQWFLTKLRLWFFQWSCMDVTVGLWRKLSTEKLMLWTVMLEKTLESPLDCKGIQPVHPKGDQSWVFIGRTDAKAETPVLWPPHGKSWLIGKDPDAGRDWGQEEKGMTEDEMAGWHHWLNGHGFE